MGGGGGTELHYFVGVGGTKKVKMLILQSYMTDLAGGKSGTCFIYLSCLLDQLRKDSDIKKIYKKRKGKKEKTFYLIKLYDGSCWGQVTVKWNMLYILLARSAAKRFSHKEKEKKKKKMYIYEKKSS